MHQDKVDSIAERTLQYPPQFNGDVQTREEPMDILRTGPGFKILQVKRIQGRIRQSIHELGTLSAGLPDHNLSGLSLLDRTDQHQLERNCVCLEVALEEATKWARTLVAQLDIRRSVGAAPADLGLIAIDQMLGETSVGQ